MKFPHFSQENMLKMTQFNPITHRMAKTPMSFGHSECSRINVQIKIFQSCRYVVT